MTQITRIWLHGLLAAFIGGGAASITSGLTVSLKDPKDFNLGTGFWDLISVVVAAFLIQGSFAAMLYLKQSPIPSWDGVTERRNRD